MSQRFGFLEPILQTYDTKLVVTFSGTDVLVLPFVDERWRAALSRIFDRASYIHAVSEQLRNHLMDLGAPSEKTITIYRSVDPDHLPAEPQGCTTSDGISIASVGRLTWQKGQIYALHAIKLLVDRGFQIRYRIAGEGAERHHLSFWIKKYQLEHVVELLGEQPRAAVRSLLQQSDVFLHPSVSEGLPNAILEASAAGLPIISTQVGGIPEAVQHDITGLLVPPADPAALSQAVAQLIEHPEQRLSMGKQGRAYMTDKFSRQREIDEWLALYQNLL
jgi:glycosyltransferase involved in cell wall biosynthesis